MRISDWSSDVCSSDLPLVVRGDAPMVDGKPKKGTRVTFQASTETFKNVLEFDFEKLEHRYRELAFLNSGVRIKLVDARHAEHQSHDLYYEGGIGDRKSVV